MLPLVQAGSTQVTRAKIEKC